MNIMNQAWWASEIGQYARRVKVNANKVVHARHVGHDRGHGNIVGCGMSCDKSVAQKLRLDVMVVHGDVWNIMWNIMRDIC